MAVDHAQGSSGWRIAGFPVHVPISAWLGVGVIAWLWLPQFSVLPQGQQYLVAAVFGVLILVSVLLHELAHAVVARMVGFPVIGVTLWALGGYTHFQAVNSRPGKEALVAFAGPATTGVIGGLAVVGTGLVDPGGTGPLDLLLPAVAWVNLFVAAFNLLPGLPLDGGALLSAAVWKISGSKSKGTLAAGYAGVLVGAAMAIIPLFVAWRVGGEPDVVFVLVGILLGMFLIAGAVNAIRSVKQQRQLEGHDIAAFASPARAVSAGMTVASYDQLPPIPPTQDGAEGRTIVVDDENHRVLGVVEPAAAQAVPPERRADTPISAVTRSLPSARAIPLQTPADQAVPLLVEHEALLLVDRTGAVAGIVLRPSDEEPSS